MSSRGLKVSRSVVVRLAWVSWWVTLLFEVGMIGFGLANFAGDPRATGSRWVAALSVAAAILVFQSMATVGVLIVRRDPQNRVGWLFCASPLLMMAGNFASAYGEYALNTNPGVLPAGLVIAQLDWLWIYGMTLFASFVVLLFPDGRLLSRRWRPVAWLGVAALACLWTGVMLGVGRLDPPLHRYHNPFDIDGFQYLIVAGVALPVVMGLGIVSGIVRYRRGDPIERLQLRWFVTAVCGFGLFVVITVLLQVITGIGLPDFVFLAALWLVPVSVGIAILRYRLYEIDVIIRKTLVYAALAATLADGLPGWYLADHLGVSLVTGQSSALAVTLSTLAVAAAFQPLRTRIQRTVDHRFYRRKYDATKSLEQFNNRLRQQIDLDALHTEVLGVVYRDAPAQPHLTLAPTRKPTRTNHDLTTRPLMADSSSKATDAWSVPSKYRTAERDWQVTHFPKRLSSPRP